MKAILKKTVNYDQSYRSPRHKLTIGWCPHTQIKGAIMNNETEKNQSKQEQGKQAPTGSVNTSDTKGNPSPGNQSQSNPPQDISKKNPPQGTDAQHQGQPKTEDEKRRAS
jgi:hypothetical protein